MRENIRSTETTFEELKQGMTNKCENVPNQCLAQRLLSPGREVS